MADESKLTLKVGLIATLSSSMIMFILGVLLVHNTEIGVLRTNQAAIMKQVEKMDAALDKIPERLASIDMQLQYIGRTQTVHSKVSKENNLLLRKNGKD